MVTWRLLSYQPPSVMFPRLRTSLWLSSTPSYPHRMWYSSLHSCCLKLVKSIRQSWTKSVSKEAATSFINELNKHFAVGWDICFSADTERSACHACLRLLGFQLHVSLINHHCCLSLCHFWCGWCWKTVLCKLLWSTSFVLVDQNPCIPWIDIFWDVNTRCPSTVCIMSLFL